MTSRSFQKLPATTFPLVAPAALATVYCLTHLLVYWYLKHGGTFPITVGPAMLGGINPSLARSKTLAEVGYSLHQMWN
jgi:hypothetical protein